MSDTREIIAFVMLAAGVVIFSALVRTSVRQRRLARVIAGSAALALNATYLAAFLVTRFPDARQIVPIDAPAVRVWFGLSPLVLLLLPAGASQLVQSRPRARLSRWRHDAGLVTFAAIVLTSVTLVGTRVTGVLDTIANPVLRALLTLSFWGGVAFAGRATLRRVVPTAPAAPVAPTGPLPPVTSVRLPVQVQGAVRFVPLERVAAVELDHGLVRAITLDGVYWTKFSTLAGLRAALGPDALARVHRQAAVNLDHVVEVVRHENDTATLRLTGGVEIPVSRANLPKLRRRLMGRPPNVASRVDPLTALRRD